jgi:hypothetical protein
MQEKSKRLLGAAVILGIGLAIYLMATAPLPSDQDQIASAIETARSAVQSRKASGVLTVVSADYHDPVIANVDQLHAYLIHAFRNSGPITVQTSANTITVHGNTAQSVSHVTLKGANNGDSYFDGNITLTWKREPARRFLVFPTTTWRVVSADYPGASSMGMD